MTNSINAIFIKQFQDTLKNAGVLIQFIMMPSMAFLMTHIVNVEMPGMPESAFITMFAGMFVGMGLLTATAGAIAEDREMNSLRFLMMAGVKSHEYLLGIGGVTLVLAFITNSVFTIMMPNASLLEMLTMLASLMLGSVASVFFGASIGLLSKNVQEAASVSSVAGLVIGFGPMIANLSGNATLERIFSILYTMNFVHGDLRTINALQSFAIIFANVLTFAVVFAWVYGKQESSVKGAIIMNKKIISVLAAVALAGGSGIGFAMWRSAGFITTENARVTTTIIAVAPSSPGTLERFSVYEGKYVTENEIIGWVGNTEAMRSPIDGLVIHTSAVQDQFVSPAEAVAVVADVNNIHILAFIEESDIGNVQVGQLASVMIETFGRRQFAGYVRHIGRITRAELSGNPLFFNISGDLTRVTNFIPVEINIVDEVNMMSLIGVNASVRISLRSPLIHFDSIVSQEAAGSMPIIAANTINTRGLVESTLKRNIYSTLGSTVERVYVEVGDQVIEGQVLSTLDTRELDIQMINVAATLRIAEINVEAAEHNHEIQRLLYAAGAIPRNDLLQSEFSLQSAIAWREQSRSALYAARLESERSVIISPMSGTVTGVIAREGAAAMGLLFVVEDTDNLRVTTSFREQDLKRIAVGMEVAIISDATGSAVYMGEISRINPAASPVLAVPEFEAEVRVTSPNTGLRIGTGARLSIILE